MTESQARKVKVGDKVHWNGDPEDVFGEVIDTGYVGFRVLWPQGVYSTALFTDKEHVTPNIELVRK